MKFKCVSKNWNDLISDYRFCKRYKSRQQKIPTGFIYGGNPNDDDVQGLHGFCVNNEEEEDEEVKESFTYFNTFGYVIAASKSLHLLVSHNLENCYVYDLVSKKHVKLPKINNSLEAALGFKCEENSINNNHICYKVICVDNPTKDHRGLRRSYNVDIYSSETGTWEKIIMKSRFPFHMRAHQIAKVIRGVFHWHDFYSDSIIAYDSENPKGRAVFIKFPKIKQFDARKDGSFPFISMAEEGKILKVWIMSNKNGQISYMDEEEDRIGASKWALYCSVSFFDIDIGFSGLRNGERGLSDIICADPNDPDIIYLYIAKVLQHNLVK